MYWIVLMLYVCEDLKDGRIMNHKIGQLEYGPDQLVEARKMLTFLRKTFDEDETQKVEAYLKIQLFDKPHYMLLSRLGSEMHKDLQHVFDMLSKVRDDLAEKWYNNKLV